MELPFAISGLLSGSVVRVTRNPRPSRLRCRRRGPAVPAFVEQLEPRSLLSAGPLSVAVSGQWIAVLHAGVDPHDFADELRSSGREVLHVYAHAVSAVAFRGDAVPNDSRVASLEADLMFRTTAQALPTGIDRINADRNIVAAIDGTDQRVDVDIAILDTGIDRNHPDLNVYNGRNFTSTLIHDWDDRHGHGTHVAGTAAALDNNFGVVGTAPGARLWAVKVQGDDGTGLLSDIIAGVDWVTARAGLIEVANMSISGIGTSSLLHAAIRNSVAAGIVYVVAAGNDGQDVYGADGVYGTADDVLLASYPEVLTVSALADSDGRAGGLGSLTSSGADDSFASFSNFSRSVIANNPVVSPGAAIDLMMPGVQILSTYKDGQYATMSGTSMAAPHAAGVAALYIAQHGRDRNGDGAYTAADVYAIRQALIDGAAAQAGVRGLSTLNDPDGHWENVGWAVTPTVDPLPPPQENPGEPAPEPERPVAQPRNDDDEDEPVDSRLDDDFDEWTAAAVQSGHSLSAAAPAVHFGVLWVAGFDLTVLPDAHATQTPESAGQTTAAQTGCGRVECLSYDGPVSATNRESASASRIDETPSPAAICIELDHAPKLGRSQTAGTADPSRILDALFADDGLADHLLSISRIALLELLPGPAV